MKSIVAKQNMTLGEATEILSELRGSIVWSDDADFEHGEVTVDGTIGEEDLEALLTYMRAKKTVTA